MSSRNRSMLIGAGAILVVAVVVVAILATNAGGILDYLPGAAVTVGSPPCTIKSRCKCQGVNLGNQALFQQNMSSCDFGPSAAGTASSFYGTNLAQASMAGANLSKANMTNAALSGTNLSNANLTGANLSGAVLTGANLGGATIDGAIFTGAVCNNLKWPDGVVRNTCPP